MLLKKIKFNHQSIDLKESCQKVKLHATPSRHLQIIAKVNGVKGYFILDTGASDSCIDIKKSEKYGLSLKKSKEKAIGAGQDIIEAFTSGKNTIRIGKKTIKNKTIILLELSHINNALSALGCKTIDGIIGADVLFQIQAMIDYNSKYLFFKT